MGELPQQSFRESLTKSIGALSKAVRGMDAGSPKSVADARLLARTLQDSGTKNGYPQITAAAATISEAPAEIVPRLVTRLIRIAEEVASSGWDEVLNVLVVEGYSQLGAGLQLKLRAPNRELHVTRTAAEAIELLGKLEIAMVVLDLVLPDMDGRNLLARLREDPRTQAIPVVVLSGAGGHDLQSECFALGADQYFELPADMDLLAVAIASTLHRALLSARDTHRDAVTSLLSRDGLRRKLRRTLTKAQRKRREVGFAILDLTPRYVDGSDDELLANNPSMVLSQVGRAVSDVLRPRDTVARWQDLELVLVLPDTDLNGARKAVDRVRAALANEVFMLAGKRYAVSLAAGVIQLDTLLPLEEAIAEADRVLLTDRQMAPRPDGLPARPKPHILIVDHDDDVAAGLKRRLASDGYEVRHVRDGPSAVRAVMAVRTVLILLEAKLPGGESFPLLGELRAMSELDRVPILMMTVTGRDLDVARAFESGADDYVMMPCSTAQLLARIRRHLKRTTQLARSLNTLERAGSIAGLFSGDQLPEFVQMLGMNRKTGRLLISGKEVSGHLDFHRGQIIGAATSLGATGLEASHSLLAVETGKFEFWPGFQRPDDGDGISASVDNLLLDVMRKRDEVERGGL